MWEWTQTLKWEIPSSISNPREATVILREEEQQLKKGELQQTKSDHAGTVS